MSSSKSMAVTESELIARIDRKLGSYGRALYRKPQGLGSYDIIEVATNHLVRPGVDLETLAREMGALAETEHLQA